ncbi:hypothetical protein GCM10022221_67890 [Actinocorallia aurea]
MATAQILDLYRRYHALKESGGVPGSEAVDLLDAFFAENGIRDDSAPDDLRTYRAVITVDLTSWWDLEVDELPTALRYALNGAKVHVREYDSQEIVVSEVFVHSAEITQQPEPEPE